MTAPDPGKVLIRIPETADTRRAMRNILVSSQAGLAQTGVLLLPLLAGALAIWHRDRPADRGPYAACLVILVCCAAALAQWLGWWASWRYVPFSWEIRETGVYRAGRLWALWSEISSVRVHRALLGSRVMWSALRISAHTYSANIRWGTPFIPFDSTTMDERQLLAVCRAHVGSMPRGRTVRLIPPWLTRVVVALFVVTVFVTLMAVRLAVAPHPYR